MLNISSQLQESMLSGMFANMNPMNQAFVSMLQDQTKNAQIQRSSVVQDKLDALEKRLAEAIAAKADVQVIDAIQASINRWNKLFTL